MALVIEDGSIVAGATSYATLAELRSYASVRGATVPVADADCEVLMIKAMDYLADQKYVGERVSIDQVLDWPRYGAYVENFPISSTGIPRQLVQAQCALAIEAQANDLLPTLTPANIRGPVTGEAVSGAVSVTYANPGRVLTVSAFAKADALLRVLLRRNGLTAIRS